MSTHNDIWRDLFDEVSTCGDNSCEVKTPRGPGTNGGCRCSERQLRRALRLVKRAIVEQEQRETELVRAHLVELVHTISESLHDVLVATAGLTVADVTVKTTSSRWELVHRGTGAVLSAGEI